MKLIPEIQKKKANQRVASIQPLISNLPILGHVQMDWALVPSDGGYSLAKANVPSRIGFATALTCENR